ncbi:MAG: agmatinase [Methanocellales archaeon]
MLVKPFFADANSSYEEADFVIYGAPFDGTSSFRSGARNAPAEIRRASYNFETYIHEYKIDLESVKICDLGDLQVSPRVEETLELVQKCTQGIVNDGKIPIMLGGEHSLSYACIKSFKQIAAVIFDAHFDLRKKYLNVKFNHACVSYHIVKYLGRENYVAIGIRSGTKEEYSFADKNLRYYSAEQVAALGIENIVKEVLGYLKPENIYLSIDFDVLDPAFAPAVSTPEPFGLSSIELKKAIRALAPRVAGFDIVEIAPDYDRGETALLGAKLVREFIAARSYHARSI